MKKMWVLLVIFAIGWLSHDASSYIASSQLEQPTGFSVLDLLAPTERVSPYDRVAEDQILVYDDKVVLDIQDAEWAGFTDTNSMDPVIDYGANAIQVHPKSTDDIHVGDIISFRTDKISGTVIHRVVKIGKDSDGWYAVTKGDNLANSDPEKVRFDSIERVLVAIIY